MANNSIQTRLSDLPSKASLSPDDILLIDDGEKTYSLKFSILKSDVADAIDTDIDEISNAVEEVSNTVTEVSWKVDEIKNEISPETTIGTFTTDKEGTVTYRLDEPLKIGTRYKFAIATNSTTDSYRLFVGTTTVNREIGTISIPSGTTYLMFTADRAYDRVRVSGSPNYTLQITHTDHLLLSKPIVDGLPSDGSSGQYLRSLGDGNTEWADVEVPSPLNNIKDAELGGIIEGMISNSQHHNIATGAYAHAEGGEVDDSGSSTIYYRTEATGTGSHAEGIKTIAGGRAGHAEGIYTVTSADAAHAEGDHTEASGVYSHAEGYKTTASEEAAHVEGFYSEASGGISHAEGNSTTASGENAHAEGHNTTASGESSHAEGEESVASGGLAHAEGGNSTASGASSHAEGFTTQSIGVASHTQGSYTTARGTASDASGFGTIANGRSQHVFGEFNIEDSASDERTRGVYVEIVGNGTPNSDMTDGTRSNARTLDWSGNEALAGSLTLGLGSVDATTITPAELKDLKEATHLDSVIIAGQTLLPTQNEMTVAQLKTALGTVSKTATGLVPALPNETTTTKYLRQDGTWAVPPDTDTNTTYTAGNGLALSGTEFRNTGVIGIKTATDSDFRSGQITLTKDSVGLAAVENKSSATIREELTRDNVLQALGYDPAGVLRYKGVQPTLADIQALTGSVGGDVWFCTGDNTQYAYNGSTWDSLGTIDLTGTITYIQNWVREYVGNSIEAD